MFDTSDKKRFITGAKQVKNAIMSNTVSRVYVASDCEPSVSKPVTELAEEKKLPLFFISTRRELGQMCGIDVKAACAAEPL